VFVRPGEYENPTKTLRKMLRLASDWGVAVSDLTPKLKLRIEAALSQSGEKDSADKESKRKKDSKDKKKSDDRKDEKEKKRKKEKKGKKEKKEKKKEKKEKRQESGAASSSKAVCELRR
jgi:hypothetical protein